MDWADQRIEKRVTFEMVSQTNLDDSWGLLEGVDLSSSSIEGAYYTDTRTSGKVRVVGEGWRRGSFIRPILEVPSEGIRRELGTSTHCQPTSPRDRGRSRRAQ